MEEEEEVVVARVSFTKCLVDIVVHPSVTDLVKARCLLGIHKNALLPQVVCSLNVASINELGRLHIELQTF